MADYIFFIPFSPIIGSIHPASYIIGALFGWISYKIDLNIRQSSDTKVRTICELFNKVIPNCNKRIIITV
ncbi:hypothetical protein [Neobacillus cucumis]|uniref:hypothetical protein n=1 Tax=Neobacillus cucumis TaxID=1740721 RepID=UPI002E208AD6|nr:hypothetical protein [Neobacillus cucumis]